MEEEGLLWGNPKVKLVGGVGDVAGARACLAPVAEAVAFVSQGFTWKIAEELKLGEAGCWLRVLDIGLEWFSWKELDIYL